MNAELDLTEATAALGRLAMGANYAHDVRLLRLALERLKALSTPPADDVREVAEQALTMLALFRPYMVAPQQIENLRNILKPLVRAEVRPHGTATDVEPVAWAIYGLESHRFLRVQEAVSDNDRRYYNVRPLFASEVRS